MSKMYTCADIAERYGVKTITVWDWIRKGKMSAIKIGRDYRISESDVGAFEENNRTTNKEGE